MREGGRLENVPKIGGDHGPQKINQQPGQEQDQRRIPAGQRSQETTPQIQRLIVGFPSLLTCNVPRHTRKIDK
jgi:hypothetical protein